MTDDPAGARAGANAPVSTTATNLFDLRSVIALLFGVYGVVLVIMGVVSGDDPENLAKAGGTNLNLDTGIGMLVIRRAVRAVGVAAPAADPRRAHRRGPAALLTGVSGAARRASGRPG